MPHPNRIEPYEQLCRDKYIVLEALVGETEINLLLNGRPSYQRRLSRRRTMTKEWPGCSKLTDADLRYFRLVRLPDGRADISLPVSLIESCDIQEKVTQKVLRDLGFPQNFHIPHWNLLVNPNNPNMQNWHQDNGGLEADNYYTLLIPLNHQQGMGRTEIVVPYLNSEIPFIRSAKTDLKAGYRKETPELQPGDGLLFSGCLWHRGTPNLSLDTRYCLYAIVTCANEEDTFEGW